MDWMRTEYRRETEEERREKVGRVRHSERVNRMWKFMGTGEPGTGLMGLSMQKSWGVEY